MTEDAATWHYIVAFAFFLLLGAIGHIVRAVFNVLPDRLSDKPMMDLVISDGYNMDDHVFGTEYDDGGYYRLDSWRNLRNASLLSGFGGLAVMLFSEGASKVIARGIDTALAFLWDLFLYRLDTVSLF
jgi:hypothetical protein